MDYRLVRSFVTAASHPTFSSAAKALFLTQPALTKQIQQLEALAGTPLFQRGRNGSVLTATGQLLLGDAHRLMACADQFGARIERIASGEEGHLSLGFGLSSISVAPEAVSAFRQRFPGVTASLDDLSSREQYARVQRGELDFGFTRLPAPAGLKSLRISSDSLALAVAAGVAAPPIDDAAFATWLEGQEMVMLSESRGPGLHNQLGLFLQALNVQPQKVHEAADLQTVLALVAARIGIAIVPASATSIAPGTISLEPLNFPGTQWDVGLVWQHDLAEPRHRHFVDTVVELREQPGRQPAHPDPRP